VLGIIYKKGADDGGRGGRRGGKAKHGYRRSHGASSKKVSSECTYYMMVFLLVEPHGVVGEGLAVKLDIACLFDDTGDLL
jgi:hypothetical protein